MDKLRDFLKSKMGQLLMALCLIPMAFLGFSGSFGGASSDPNTVATIGKRSITTNELQNAITNYRQALIAQGANASQINESVLKDQALQDLINSDLLVQQANKLGMGLSDKTISMILQKQSAFQDENGEFSNALFANFLKTRGITKDQLFDEQRSQYALNQLNRSIVSSSIYPISAINSFINLQLQTRNVWLHRFNWQDFANQVTVSDNEISDYYHQHQNDLQSIAMVDLSYITLTPEEINVEAVTNEEINQQYEAYKQELNIDDMREISQILLTGEDAGSKSQEVIQKLADGAKFADLAKAYSDDPSAENGGDIGRFNAAVFGNEANKVKKALNGLKVGDVSKPVTTSYGIQIFTVTSNNNDKIPSIDDVRPELEDRAIRYKREQAFSDKVTQINELAVNGYSIQDIADQEKVTFKTIKDFQEEDNQTELGQPIIIEKAFDDNIIQEQAVTANINVNSKTYWIQPVNYRPIKSLSAEEATPVIKALLTKQKASKLALQEAQTTAKAIISKEDMTQQKVKFSALGSINRQSQKLLEAEKAVAFSQKAPDSGVISISALTDLGASVLVVDKVNEVEQSQLSDIDQRQTALIVRQNLGQSDLQDYLEYLRITHGVKINEEAIHSGTL